MEDRRLSAPVLEVFASIQGEGAYMGQLQSFVRLRGCPLRCRWCDTPGSWELASTAGVRVATPDGPERHDQWATPFQVACWVASVEPDEPRPVSLTGGEPLLWPDFLIAFKSMLGGRALHLETAGGHPATLERVLDAVDHVSLDLKLPDDLDAPVELRGDYDEAALTGERAPRDERGWTEARRRCLQLVADRAACAKVVVSADNRSRAYDPLFEDVLRLAPALPVYVQPVTPMHGVEPPPVDRLVDVAERARELGLTVRVVPQVHRMLGLP